MRLLFVENLSVLSAQWATTALAVDALDARAAGLTGKTDDEVRRFAIETGRVLVTLDADFGNLIRFSPAGTPGVVWLRPRPPTEANIRLILGKWLRKLSEIDLHGRLLLWKKISYGSVELSITTKVSGLRQMDMEPTGSLRCKSTVCGLNGLRPTSWVPSI